MFTLSAKAIYGVTAVVELAQHYRSGPIQIRDIASRHEIPQHYLEQILSTLKRSGLVRSYRGARGGYELTAPPDSITSVFSCAMRQIMMPYTALAMMSANE